MIIFQSTPKKTKKKTCLFRHIFSAYEKGKCNLWLETGKVLIFINIQQKRIWVFYVRNQVKTKKLSTASEEQGQITLRSCTLDANEYSYYADISPMFPIHA